MSQDITYFTMSENITPPVESNETTFSHEVQSAVPSGAVFVFDPIHEAEMLREIIK